MNYDGGPVEENAGNIVRMGCVFIASKQAVEDHAGVRKCPRLNGKRRDTSGIWRIRSPDFREHDVVSSKLDASYAYRGD